MVVIRAPLLGGGRRIAFATHCVAFFVMRSLIVKGDSMSRSSDSRQANSRSAAADRKSTTRQKGGVNSVEVAGILLRAISEAAGPARLADIARATGMPTAKAHRYIVSLIRAGLVERDPNSGHYDLGPL